MDDVVRFARINRACLVVDASSNFYRRDWTAAINRNDAPIQRAGNNRSFQTCGAVD